MQSNAPYATIILVIDLKFVAKAFDELTTRQLYEILKSRSQIFMLEQKIHCQDMDDLDYRSRHCFLEDGGRVVAYLRAFYKDDDHKTVKIGRVLTLEHKKGIGRALMEQSLDDIFVNLPCDHLYVEAQAYAAGFYEKFGFVITSEPFLEEGIPHVVMQRSCGK